MAIRKLYIHPNNLEEIRSLCPLSFTKEASSNTPINSEIVVGSCQKMSGSNYTGLYKTFGYTHNDCLEKVDEDIPRIACYLYNFESEVVDGISMPYIEYNDETMLTSSTMGLSIQNNIGNNRNNSNLQNTKIDGTLGERYYLYNWYKANVSKGEAIWTDDRETTQADNSTSPFSNIIGTNNNSELDTIVIDGSIPIFVDEASAREYIATGNVLAGKCFNLDNMMLSEPTQHMISTRTYDYDSDKNCTGQDNETHVIYLRTFTNQSVSGYVADDKSKYNIRLKVAQNSSNIDTVQVRAGSGSFETMTITEFNNSVYAKGYNTWKDFKPYNLNGYVKGNLWRCTFKVYASEQDANLANNPQTKDMVVPLNFDEEGNPINMSDTGTPATSESDLNDDYKDGTSGVVTLYQLSKANLVAIGSKLFSYDTDIVNAFKVFGDSPINAIVSLYHTPIDISHMCQLSNDSLVKLGLYNLTCEGAQTVVRYGKLQTLGSIVVNPFYNDFRDYNNFEFELHLPFSTPIPLDAREVMNKTLTIKATCDAYAMQMRYYVCIDGVVKKTIDCSFGHQVAIMGNDFAGKAKETRQEVFNLATVGVNIATGSFSRVDSANQTTDVLNVGNIASSASGAQASLNNLTKEPTKTMVGNFASGCAECDVLYPYLSITETASIKPSNLESTYGRPTNYIGRLGNLTGYTCAELTRLTVDCTSAEREEIIALLERGIIL